MKSPLIIKCKYWESGKSSAKRGANYLKYIGTRDGVELNSKTYLDYIGTRPGVEKMGEHGLFSDEGKIINLNEERKNLLNYRGRIYSLIVSLCREDAEATGFNCADRWREFVHSHKLDISLHFNIPAENLIWFGAFHNSETHPHIHLMFWSRNPETPGYTKNLNLNKLKAIFAKDIFRDELTPIYQEQTEHRNELTKIAKEDIISLLAKTKGTSPDLIDPELVSLFTKLSDKLKNIQGRKVYGYLPRDAKKLVDEITDKLCDDGRIRRLYNMWYDCKYAILGKYTLHMPEKLPLSKENSFRAIKNAIIREAIRAETGQLKQNNLSYSGSASAMRSLDALSRLFASAGTIFAENIDFQIRQHPEVVMDRKDMAEEWVKEHGYSTGGL